MRTDQDTLGDRQPLLDPDGLIIQSPIKRQNLLAVCCCLLVMVLISASYAFTEAPLYRLYESVLCREYYKEHDTFMVDYHGEIPEEKCKLPSIQQDLSMITSKQVQINLLPCKYICNVWKIPFTDK
jgi:hypothetical protein